jgi:heat shock protein HslJ
MFGRLGSAAVAAVLFFSLGIEGQAMADAAPEGPNGKWIVEEIDGQPASGKAQVTIEIGADGQVAGSGGCNRFRGPAKIADSSITFGPVAATRMMCEPEISDQESKFFRALDAVRGWRFNGSGLILLDASGNSIFRLGASS